MLQAASHEAQGPAIPGESIEPFKPGGCGLAQSLFLLCCTHAAYLLDPQHDLRNILDFSQQPDDAGLQLLVLWVQEECHAILPCLDGVWASQRCPEPLAQAAPSSPCPGPVPEPEKGKPLFRLADTLDLRRVNLVHENLKDWRLGW